MVRCAASVVKALCGEEAEFANRANRLIKELEKTCRCELTNIRVINRYLIEDLSDKAFRKKLAERFSEPPADTSYTDGLS